MREFVAALLLFTHAGFFIFSFLLARALRLRCPACGRRVHRSYARGEAGGPMGSRLACPHCGHAFEPRKDAAPGKPR